MHGGNGDRLERQGEAPVLLLHPVTEEQLMDSPVQRRVNLDRYVGQEEAWRRWLPWHRTAGRGRHQGARASGRCWQTALTGLQRWHWSDRATAVSKLMGGPRVTDEYASTSALYVWLCHDTKAAEPRGAMANNKMPLGSREVR